MITHEQVRKALFVLDNISEDCIGNDDDNEAVCTLMEFAREEVSNDEGPITAEWCEAYGGTRRRSNDYYVWWFGGICVAVDLRADGVDVRVGNLAAMSMWRHNPTRGQLLSLLIGLKG